MKIIYGIAVFFIIAFDAPPSCCCEAFIHFGFSSCTTTTTTVTTTIKTNTRQQQHSLDDIINKENLITRSIHRCNDFNGLNGITQHNHLPSSASPSSFFKLYAKPRTKNNDDDDDPKNNRYDYNRQENKQWLKERFDFTDEQIKQRNHYKFLTKDNSILVARADWLQEEFVLNKMEMNKIVQSYTTVLSLKSTNLKTKVDCFKSIFGQKVLNRMVLKHPSVIGARAEDIQPKIKYLKHRLNLDESKVIKLIQSNPSILAMSLENNIKPTIEWIQQQLSLGDAELFKLMTKSTLLMSCSIESNLRPKIDWLQQRLDLNRSQIRKMILKLPEILAFKIDTLNNRLTWLQNRLSLKDEELKKIAVRSSTFLGCNEQDNMEPTLEWIQQRLSLTDAGLSNLILIQPELLGCSVPKNLAPTIEFYIEASDVEEEVILKLLGRTPRLLAAGLPRLKIRLQEARDIGLSIDTGVLQRMAICSPQKWAKSIAYQRRKLDKDGGKKDELW